MLGKERIVNCACKGIRKCAVCSPALVEKEKDEEKSIIETKKIYLYCNKCDVSTLINESNRNYVENFLSPTITDLYCNCKQTNLGNDKIRINGILVIDDFINQNEEKYLCEQINKSKWIESQSGRFKQDFGPKANFNKKKIKYSTFTGLPFYSKFLVERLYQVNKTDLKSFVPVELCNLRYESERGACIDPHYDDFWLWGERLISINLLANTFLTLLPDNQNDIEVFIPLKNRSMVVISKEARYNWLHAIKKSHITSTRIVTTLRELSDEFKKPNFEMKVGQEIEHIALTYKGISVGDIDEMALGEKAIIDEPKETDMNEFDRWNLQNLVREKLIEFNFDSELNLIKNGKERLIYNLDIEDAPFFLKLKKINLFKDFLYEIQTKIIKENFNLSNVNYFNRFLSFYDEFNQIKWNMCLQFKIDYQRLDEMDHFENDQIFKVGAQIAQWYNFSIKFLTPIAENDFETISNFNSIQNLILITNNFEHYKQLLIEKLKYSKIDLSVKSKSIATIYHFRNIIKQTHLKENFRIGFVLNDFVPKKMFFNEKNKLGNLTAYQNITLSYLLNDLAIAIISLLIAEKKEPEKLRDVIKVILKGFFSLKELNDIEFEFLYQLILMNLILKIIETDETNSIDKEIIDQLINLFNIFYLEDSF